MIVRRLLPQDALAFRALRLDGLRRHPEAFGASYSQEAAQPLTQFEERLATGIVLGAWQADGAQSANLPDSLADNLSGIVGLRHGASAKTRHIATIWGMYVRPESRGTGLARPLLAAALSQVPPGCRSVRLSVVTTNSAALRLYESLGFRIWGIDQGALQIGGVFHDEALMRLDF